MLQVERDDGFLQDESGRSLGRNVAIGAVGGFLVGAVASAIAVYYNQPLADPVLLVLSYGALGAAAGTVVALVWTAVQRPSS
jgi:ABC-type uncharacterized transport system permease subunit